MKRTFLQLVVLTFFIAFCWTLLLHTIHGREEAAALKKMLQQTNRRLAKETAEVRRLANIEKKRQIPPCDIDDWVLKGE